GAWGVMNAPLGQDAAHCRFFMPDPWSFDEGPVPIKNEGLLALPRYVAQNYGQIDRAKAAWKAVQFATSLLRPDVLPVVPRFTMNALAAPGWAPSIDGFASLLDYLSARIFSDLLKKHRPAFSIVFINTVAHLQHHHWQRGAMHPEMRFGLQLVDEGLGYILKTLEPDDGLVVMNALKQKNVEKGGFHCYRQLQPEDAVRRMGLAPRRVEQCMTNDSHLFFDRAEDAKVALQTLKEARLDDGSTPFYAELEDASRVFYQVVCEHALPPGVRLHVGGKVVDFFEIFAHVCERTGAHVPEGDVYSRNIEVPSRLLNHKMFDIFLGFHGLERPSTSVEQQPIIEQTQAVS
ncbi:MAG: hypothetical protein AAF449_22350, partial [Myxococcota bacterium]